MRRRDVALGPSDRRERAAAAGAEGDGAGGGLDRVCRVGPDMPFLRDRNVPVKLQPQ